MATTPIAVKLLLALLNFAGMSSSPRVARQPVIFSRAPRYVPNPAEPRKPRPSDPTPRFHVYATHLKQDCSTRRLTLQLNPCCEGAAVVVGRSVHVRA
jgi:hypothetical protein